MNLHDLFINVFGFFVFHNANIESSLVFLLNFRNEIYGLPLVLIDNLRIDLSCANIAVAEKFGDGVEVCTVGQREGGESVASDVE